MDKTLLAQRIHEALPQTQCTRCGYPDCKAYAQAIAHEGAAINQCPPGGHEGIERLAAITVREVVPLNPEYGIEAPRQMAWIDENWCIGCTLCIKACPVDAIVGVNQAMHTVIESACTGCELCIPVCPVDCIVLENASDDATGWQAWSNAQAQSARQRHAARLIRLELSEQRRQTRHLEALKAKAKDLPAHSQITDPQLLEKKRSIVELALAKARQRQSGNKPHTS